MQVMITGVGGLIGSNLADWIITNKPDVHVVGIDDFSGSYQENVNEQVKLYKLNIAEHSMDDIFTQYKFDLIFHFAAYAAEGLSPFVRSFNYKNNLIVTAKLITNAIKFNVGRFIFTSSMATYGRGNPPFSEKDVLAPIDPYGIAKMAAELDLKIANDQHGLDYCILRPHNVYGPNQNIWDKYRNVLGIWMNQHLNGKAISIFGSGKQKRAFSYIEDCLLPIWNAGVLDSASKETINLGGTQPIEINNAADLFLNIIGSGKKRYFQERYEVKDAWSTWDKSARLLNYKENIDFKTGLKNMWVWAKKQPKRNQQIWENYELDKDIYEYWAI